MNKKKNFIEFNYRVAFFLLVVIILGIVLIALSKDDTYPEVTRSIFKEIGVVLMVAVSMTLVYEYVLRKYILEETSEALYDVLNNAMPENYVNIRKSGIVDAYHRLDINRVSEIIDRLENERIRFSKIWIPYLERLEHSLIDAINNRNCQVYIMLLDPEAHEAIDRRASCLPYDNKQMFVNEINKNLRIVTRIYNELREERKKDFHLKLHKDFISASIIGYGETFIMGFYLHGRIASEGMQIRVRENKSPFFKEIDKHYTRHWESIKEDTKIPDLETRLNKFDTHQNYSR